MVPDHGDDVEQKPRYFYRQAMLPIGASRLGDPLSLPSTHEESVRTRVIEKQLTNERALLQRNVAAPYLAAAMAYASEHFSDLLPGPLSERAAITAHDYLFRACGRPRPFGWFGAVGVGTTGPEVAGLTPHAWEFHTLPSASFQAEQAERSVARDPASSTYIVNPLLYNDGHEVRYLASRTPNRPEAPEEVTAPLTDPLSTIIERAARPTSWDDLVDLVQQKHPCEGDERERLLRSLIAWDLLIPSAYFEALRPEGVAPASTSMEGSARSGTFHTSDRLVPVFDKSRTALFVSRSGRLSLPSTDIHALIAGADVLRRLCPSPAVARLESFKRRFLERFQGASVPLQLAISNEAGLAYGADVWDEGAASGLRTLNRRRVDRSQGEASRERHLFERVLHSNAQVSSELALTSHDVEILATPDPLPFPLGIAVCAALVSSPVSAHASFRLDRVVGPSGARLFSRFWQDPDVRQLAEHHVREEKCALQNGVLAEVIFGPRETLDFARRPNFYDYSIDCYGWASTGTSLSLSDLYVSVVGDRVILSSKSLGVEVVPRITSPHNYALGSNPRAYRLFGDMQGQGSAADVSWRWGPLAEAPHLPRVTWRGITLTPQRWRLHRDEWLRPGGTHVQNAARLYAAMQQRNLPRYVTYRYGDEPRIVDWQGATSLVSFARRARSWASVVLTEEESFNAKSKEEAASWHSTEVVIPLTNPSTDRTRLDQPFGACPPRVGAMGPGSDWVFLKLYGTPLVLDSVLSSAIRHLIEDLRRESLLKDWYFVRYTDPDPHIRLRLLAPGALEAVTQRLAHQIQPDLDAFRLWTVDISTHRPKLNQASRPIERRWAANDSDLMLEFLGDKDLQRWQLSLLSLLSLLAGAEMDAPSQLRLIDRHLSQMQTGVGNWKAVRTALGQRWRAWRPLLGAAERGDAHKVIRDRVAQRDVTIPRIIEESNSTDVISRLMHRTFNRSAIVPDIIEEMAILELARRTVLRRLMLGEGAWS